MLSRNFKRRRQWGAVARYLRIKAGGGPRLVNLEVTKLCNAQCDFCACWTIKGYPQLADYGPVIERLKPIVLSLNGGEPLLRKDFIDIVGQVRPHCSYLCMVTHGQLLTEEKVQALWEAGMDQISVSCNYIGEEHDRERRIPGLFRHFENLIPKMVTKGFDFFAFNTVIMDRNLDQIVPLAKLAKAWGIKIAFSSYNKLKTNKDEYLVKPEQMGELEAVIGELLELRKTQKNILSSEYYLKKVPGYFSRGAVEDCQAGLSFVQVTPDGYIQRCAEMPKMCHWTEYDPKKVARPNPCEICWFACRGESEQPMTPARVWELAFG